ncbi:MAG: ATP-binding protein [Deltaproteobacteria bacterium]|nr:ATP-binding protein [Deltaproteobacteria bacterium]
MKLKRVLIENFKGVEAIEFSMETPSQAPRQLTALLGDNCSGKTSILQAIALTLSMATRRTRDMTSFNWHGFLPERVPSLGPTYVELEVVFEPEEVTLTSELFEAWRESLSSETKQVKRIVAPSQHTEVKLQFYQGRVNSPQGPEGINQFLGRFYVKALKDTRPELRDRLAKLGDIFWFDQHRNLGYLMAEDMSDEKLKREGWQAGVEQLREFLVGWWGHHTTASRRGKDLIEPLERRLQMVFPGTRFVGIMPRGEGMTLKANDFYFLIDRDGRIYDLAEMSSGEQAVFPLAYEFVRLDIQRSIVLIDELELHLHPPEQQRLLAALPKIGPDCQFLITTHSEFLSSVIPNEHEVRLEKGTRCL